MGIFMIRAIIDRRSIRKFKSDDIPKSVIEEIIKAGILAPSSKNRQPWKFIVTAGAEKERLLTAMEEGLEREKREPLLPDSADYRKGAEYTLGIMRQAPVVIFIVNVLGQSLERTLMPEERIYEICNAQSIGAAVENMILAATEAGLGSLWICDTFFAQREFNERLNTDGELFAAMAVGYADEMPPARPRKSMEDVVDWRFYE